MSSLVSVVIPTYQRPTLVRKALTSVLQQTYQNLEVIVVEDGSDSSLATDLGELRDARVSYHRHGQRQGLSAARNTGARLARGAYVAFLDDDDEWLPSKLEKQMARMVALDTEKAMVYCGMTTVDRESGEVRGQALPIAGGPMRRHIYHGLLLPQSSMLVDRQALLAIGGFSEDLVSCIDHDIWLKMAHAGFVMAVVPEPLVITYVGADEQRMTNRLGDRLEGISQFFGRWRPVVVAEEGLEAWRKIETPYYDQYTWKVLTALYSGQITRSEAQRHLSGFARIQTTHYSQADAAFLALGAVRLLPARDLATRFRQRVTTLTRSGPQA